MQGISNTGMEKSDVSHWAAGYVALLADHSIQGILLLDNRRIILQANTRAADLLGVRNVSDLLGKTLYAEEGSACLATDQAATGDEGASPRSGRYMLSLPAGTATPADFEFLGLNGEGLPGRPHFLVLITALSPGEERDRLNLQTEKLAAMDSIVAGIAHELNNPMTAILGYAELLLATEKDPKRKQRVALIAEEADRCGKIIASMLTYTRSYGRALETAHVNVVLGEVLDLQAYQLKVDGIAISTAYDQTIPASQLLTAGLRRLFLNLIHNAHQALLEVPIGSRHLWISTELRANSIFIQFADSGPGIPKADLNRIFDPFYTTRPLGQGMGLGLSVAFGVVHEHNGKIWAEPRPGGGAALNIELPLRFQAS